MATITTPAAGVSPYQESAAAPTVLRASADGTTVLAAAAAATVSELAAANANTLVVVNGQAALNNLITTSQPGVFDGANVTINLEEQNFNTTNQVTSTINSPSGNTGEIQYNSGANSFASDPYFTYDNSNVLTPGIRTDGYFYSNGSPFIGGGNAAIGNFVFTGDTMSISDDANISLTIQGNSLGNNLNQIIINPTSVDLYAFNNSPYSYAELYLDNSNTEEPVAQVIVDGNSTPTQIWTFDATGNITLPSNTASINYANGDPYGGGTVSIATNSTPGIMALGNGFSLNASNQVSTANLYSTNLSQPTQHYGFSLDTNGVLHLPDQSIINGSTLRGVPGTGELNYTGITIGPDSGNAENTWMWVDASNAYIATDYSNVGYTWTFGADGGTIFPTLTTQRGDNPSGTISGQTLLFGNSLQEAIISTPDGTTGNEYSQRLVINPGAGNNFGEGGDIYLWAGRGGDGSGSGGDIKIRGGQGGANTQGGVGGDGGYIRMEAGDAASTGGNPGYIQITGGSSNTQGGYVSVTGGVGATVGGDVKIYGGYGQATGGNVNIWGGGSGNGQSNEGHVNIETGGNTWTFAADGNLTLPLGGIITEGTIPAYTSLTGNTITLTPSGGTSADQQLVIYPTAGPIVDANHLHLTSGNLYNTELFLGDDFLYVKLANTGNIVINSNDLIGNSAQWIFNANANTIFPGNLIGNGASPAPSINGFDTINAINFSAIGNITGAYFSGNGSGLTDVGAASVPGQTILPTIQTITVSDTSGIGNAGGGGSAFANVTVSNVTPVTEYGVIITSGTSSEKYKTGALGSIPGTVKLSFSTGLNSTPFTVYAYVTSNAGTYYSNSATGTSGICLLAGTQIALSDGTHKAIEDITYTDKLLSWDFDRGCYAETTAVWIKRSETGSQYNLLTFSDGTTLRTFDQHRIFNKQAGAFTYPMTAATPIGTVTVNEHGQEITLTRKQVIRDTIEYYNVITDYHMNLFSDSVLTSCRFNNIYPMVDMKFEKDGRTLRPRAEFANIPDRFFHGLRLAEQTADIETVEWYVNRLLATEASTQPELAF